MLDFAISFINNHIVIFYILLVFSVILEGPITILTLSLLAPKIGFSYWEVLFFAFLGDFGGDLLHYFVGRFFKKFILKKDFSQVKKIEEKLKKHSLFDKLIVIKYTPPITSLGLLYLGYSKISIKNFIKNDIILCIFSSIFITTMGFHFGYLFRDNDNFLIFISFIFISFIIFYFLLRIFTKYIIKKIYE